MTSRGTVECKGWIEHRGRQISVDCAGCKGPRSLTDQVCFMGLAGRVTPGFTGEVVLRAGSDHRYKGAMVEALSSCSEIMDLIASLAPKGSSRRTKELRDEVMDTFRKDPRSLERMDPSELSGRIEPSERERAKEQLGTVMERTRRMLVRLEG